MKKLVSMLLSVLMFAALAGCRVRTDPSNPYANDKKADSNNTLDIIAINKGYGISWLIALADEFTKQHPDIEITIRTETDDEVLASQLGLGLAYSKYDLFFSTLTPSNVSLLADISDVYNGAPDGTAVKERMDPALLRSFASEDENGEETYYSMPWVQSLGGLLANNEALTKALGADWQTKYPVRTTAELENLAAVLKGKNLSAFIHAADTSYYQYLYEVWWAQYEGLDAIGDFFSGRSYDAEGNPSLSPSIFLQEGRVKAVETLESLLSPSKGYSYDISNNIGWNETQTRFMLGDAAFLPLGDWTVREMATSFPNSDIRILRTPVVSSLAGKFGITEEELRAVIDYADGVTNEAPALSPKKLFTAEQVIEEVAKARKITFSYADRHTAYVASYGRGKQHAVEFLKFMTSNGGQKIFAEVMQGPTLPFGYDVSKDEAIWNSYSPFAKSRWDIAKDASLYLYRFDLPLGKQNLLPFRITTVAPLEVLLTRSNDRKTANDIIMTDYNYYTASGNSAWNDLLRKAGLRT